ncbi:hypothetical protein CCHR01_16555 [Colletotrichum chrysophilum]|uniref:Uncharacterized protein n=1 Tax=Colletotrichum chrysophilum TaxID=1836956 RepID=A0AAD9A485_9PEZI|nr:hypothetical protein CCHR01_16555 [Colletotrichum chrysophilum]
MYVSRGVLSFVQGLGDEMWTESDPTVWYDSSEEMEMVLFICALWKKSPWALDKGGTSNKSGLDWTGLEPKKATLSIVGHFVPGNRGKTSTASSIQPTSMTQSRS